MDSMAFSRKEELRFWKKVHIGQGKYLEDGCWNWTAGTVGKVYGYFNSAGSMHYAHRIAWTLTKGPIPKGEGHHGTCVLHKCDNRLCVRPSHLFLGSQADNLRDMAEKGRAAKGSGNGQAKLTEEQVLEIRASSEAQRVLAARYGVSQTLVSKIRLRKFWKHL